MDVGLLRTFLAIYRQGTVTGAARLVHLSQPAVSQQLKALEAQAGRPLFVRLARGLAPTPAGHELAHDVAPHLDGLAAVVEAHRGGAGALRGTLLLGGPADLLGARVLPALAPLIDQGVRVRARAGLAQPLLDAAERDELDLVIAGARGIRKSVELERLFDETFVLVAGARWATRVDRAALQASGAAALAGVPLVAYADDLPILRRYFREVWGARPRGPAAIVVDDLRAVIAAVIAGAGVSVVPRYLADAALRAGELTVLHEPRRPPRNTLYLASKPAALRQPRVAAVRTLLLRAAVAWTLCLALLVGCRVPRPVVVSEEARIQHVEEGLIPAVVIRDRTTGRPIEERMARYGVSGVGVAVIDAGRVIWSRRYGDGPDAAEAARALVAAAAPAHESGRVYLPERGQGAVVLTSEPALADEVMRAVAEEYRWPDDAPPVVEKTVAAVSPRSYDALAGSYRLGSASFVVARDGDRLTLAAPGGSAAELYPEAPDRFFLLETDATVIFERSATGEVMALRAVIAGREIRAGRVLTP